MLTLLRKYLIVGGMPEAVKTYIDTQNTSQIRKIQQDLHKYYAIDASQYDKENRLKIRRIYDMIPSLLEQHKKRVVAMNIENKKGKTISDYKNEIVIRDKDTKFIKQHN